MRTTKIIYPLVLILLILGSSSCFLYKKSSVKDTVTLNYKLTEGQVVNIKSDVKTKFESEQMGQTISIDMNSSSVLANKVVAVEEDNSFNIEMEFIDMQQGMEGPMGSGDTDFTELKGKKVNFKVSGIGESSDLVGFEELPDITNAMGETVGGDMYKEVTKGIFFKLPDHPVKTGDSWTTRDSSDMPYGGGSLKTVSKTIYIVTEKLVVGEEDCLKIDITGTAKTAGEFEQSGMQLSMDRNSTSSGHLIFAYNKGMYLSMELTSKTEGLIDVPAAGMTIPQSISSTTNISVEFK